MSEYKTRKTPGDTSWFRRDRFGLFIHFGLYSMPARHEWVKKNERIPEEKYDKYFSLFNPDLYDPRDWARKAKAAGMKYAVMTAKHHEGFCLFDSKYTEYKSTNTPCGRDLIKEYADAFHAEGLRVGLYYSLLDWHHPDFTVDCIHPRKDDPGAEKLNEGRDMHRYARYMRDQVTELLTNYGKIDILWFDFSYTCDPTLDKPWQKGKGSEDWEADELIKTARSINPDIIIDNRTGIEQDLWTPEQYQPLEWVRHKETGELVTWEACQTLSGSWGYHRDEATWKSSRMLIEMLINTVSIGGNLIMNVGPTGRGYLDYRAEDALSAYAEWMKYSSRSVYGCTMADGCFTAPRGTRLTQSEDGSRLYIHLIEYPFAFLEFFSEELARRIDYAQFLHDGSEVLYSLGKVEHFSESASESNNLVAFSLPPVKPHTEIPVIEIFLK